VDDLAGHLADAAADLPQLAAGPDRCDVTRGIRDPILPGDTEGAQPDQRPARLNQRETRGHEDARRLNSPLDFGLRPPSSVARSTADGSRYRSVPGAGSESIAANLVEQPSRRARG